MRFASLHHHTTYSYLDGYGTPEQHHERAEELEMGAMAFTEHGNISSHVRHEQEGKKRGVKPIFGCELYAGPVAEDKKKQRKNHLTVLAENLDGYQNLLRVVSRGWDEGFYYEPTVSGAMLAEHKEGLIVLSGCTASLLATSLVGGKNVPEGAHSYARARRVAERYRDELGDAFYLEVQAIPDLAVTRDINQAYEMLSKELSIPLVATADVHYVRPGDSDIRKILHGQRGGNKKSFEEMGQEWDYDIDASFILSDKNVYRRLRDSGMGKAASIQAVLNTEEIAQRCNVELPKIESLHYPLPGDVRTPKELYRRWLNEGWRDRGFDKLPREERNRYVERAKYESALIEDKGFTDYFLVIADSVKFAKRAGIPVGPARGSAAASLVCYLLRITEVNPMKFPTLIFERFIDHNRHDLPDIDLDFDDDRRHEMREYLVAKYGAERVGNIGTFTQYKGKNSLDDVARVHRIPEWEIKTVKDLLLERSSGDLRAAATIEDTVEMFPQVAEVFEKFPMLWDACKLEGNVRGMSVHAAGLVVANEPLTNACAVYTRETKEGRHEVLSVDKYDAEYLNVLKLDYLGLKTMGLIRIALEEIGMGLPELYDLPLDDPEVIQGFREGDVIGVFQFDGRAMRSVNNGVVPNNFMEICDINALARPGPLHSGASAEYMDVKHGRKQAEHYHPIVDKITRHTNYQVVYQEQILQIVRELGDFSWEEAARIRKIISKKRGEQEFNSMRKKFIKGAKKHGMTAKDADRVFSMLATAGAYAFNAAHCVSYGMLAYWTMWLKRKHPASFYVAALRKYDGDDEKKSQLLRDAAKKDLDILPPELNQSDLTWSLTEDKTGLRAGFLQVKGIGYKTASAILEERDECGGFDSWDDMLQIRGIGKKTISVIKDFIDDPDPFELDLLKNKIHQVKQEIKKGKLRSAEGERLPVPTHKSIEVPYERGPDEEVVWLGVIRDRNYKDLFELHHSRTGQHLDPSETKDPHLVNWLVMTGEDDSDLLVVTIDRWKWPHMKDEAWDIRVGKDLVLVRGVKKGFQARRAVYVSEMWVIDPD